MKYVPKYCIKNSEGKVVMNTCDNALKLEYMKDEELDTNENVCKFKSPDAAENFIWKNEFLEIDPTLRPFRI